MLDARSEQSLLKVHPDLIRVARLAYTTSKQAFVITPGLRTLAEEKAHVASGTSQTLHSRHFPNKQGFVCAIDVVADSVPGGKLDPDWNPAHYQPIAAAFLLAAHECNVLIEWGGNWKTLKDWGHFQLPWAVYP